MYRYKCIVSYDGTNYMGFQIQEELPTIELEIKKAINKGGDSSVSTIPRHMEAMCNLRVLDRSERLRLFWSIRYCFKRNGRRPVRNSERRLEGTEASGLCPML